MGHSEPQADIPFIVEAWAETVSTGNVTGRVYVNRTPSIDDAQILRDADKDLRIFGVGLEGDYSDTAPKTGGYAVCVNLTAPYVPFTSDGKVPNLEPFAEEIFKTIGAAMRKAQRTAPSDDDDDDDDSDLLPRKKCGDDGNYCRGVMKFCALIESISRTMDFKVGSRGWCYILERHGLRKGSFDTAEKLITACRKSGDLPLGICAEDVSRRTIGIETIDEMSVEQRVEHLITDVRDHAHERYMPINFWDEPGLYVYVEVVVEKLDLRNLFEPVCREFHVRITSMKGWSDVNARADMMQRFKEREAAGQRCVLLACTDHDPGGFHIADKLLKNLQDLEKAVGWSPEIWRSSDSVSTPISSMNTG